MYDNGNQIHTSYNGNRIQPYRDEFVPFTSGAHFGPGSVMYMDLQNSMMILLSQNTGGSSMAFWISGNLGADGGGQHESDAFESGRWKGFMTMTCNGHGNDAGVNHLFVFDTEMSPDANHILDSNTDSDNDRVEGIGAGSPFLYVLYATNRGEAHCHSQEQHRAIFDAAIAALEDSTAGMCPQPRTIGGATEGGIGECSISFSHPEGIERTIVNPYNIGWDANSDGRIGGNEFGLV
eukprot:SAG31_NODE_365_length_16833_cov_98.502032_5_plen_236_part_00